MDIDVDGEINDFEKLLRDHSVSKPLLYTDKITEGTSHSLKSIDVINNVSKQIKALSTNEKVTKSINNAIKDYKESGLTSITLLSLEPRPKHVLTSDFDTQHGYDTQLLLATKHAEAVTDLGAGATQEFDIPFHQQCNYLTSHPKLDSNVACENINSDLKINSPLQNQSHQDDYQKRIQIIDKEFKTYNSVDVCDTQKIESGSNASTASPILLSKKTYCELNTSFPLESFEKFEAIALPIVHENSDDEAVKQIINLKMSHDNKTPNPDLKQFDEKSSENGSTDLSPILKLKTNREEIKMLKSSCLLSNDKFAEDEIIFSSDEEADDLDECELPLTCALETSFYKQEHVLDKSIYVGFQTASNKSIQVLTDSFSKAKSILNDCCDNMETENPFSLTELVEIYDSTNKGNIVSDTQTEQNINNTDKSTTHMKNSKKMSDDINNSVEKKVDILPNKTIVCAEEHIKIDDDIMQEFEQNLCMDDNKLHTNSDSKKPCNEVTHNSFDAKNLDNKCFEGFKTASNKLINISERAYAHSNQIFKDIQLVGDINNSQDNYTDTTVKTKNEIQNVCKESTADLHFGFKTASNVPIHISENALLQSKRILEEFNCDNSIILSGERSHNIEKRKSFQGFKTASNNDVKISKEALEKSKKIFQDISVYNIDDSDQNPKNKLIKTTETENVFQGFKTASNNLVKISKEALEKSKKVFQDINDFSDYETKEYQKQEIGRLSETKNAFKGFKTASDKPVKITEDALENSKKIFQDIDDFNFNSEKISHQNQILKRSPDTNVFQGFKTARNNPMKISKEALEKSKKVFQDISDYNNCDIEQYEKQKFVGLTERNNMFKGFQTASNNPVKISKEALEKSKKIFQDISDDNYCESEKINLHKQRLNGLPTTNSVFQGFKTASNNPVNISNEALAKSKKIFDDISDDNDCTRTSPGDLVNKNTESNMIGFQTANNKLVNVSEEALAKSKNIFEDIDSMLKTKIKQKLNSELNRKNVSDINISHDRNLCDVKSRETISNKTQSKNYNVSNIINTEVIKDFNETMFTEDFINKSPRMKRACSPILSCPKPKRVKGKLTKQDFEKGQAMEEVKRYVFNINYKKIKKYNLLDVYEMEDKVDFHKEIKYDIDNILSFEFVGNRNDVSNFKWTTADIKKCFLESVEKNIIPDGWLDNHMKLIMLKLVNYEERFQNSMLNVCSVSNVLEQLKYRYDRELYNVERPVLRKILEKDEVPSWRLVLQVLKVYKDGVATTNADLAQTVELLLSDGWYCVKATIDKMLTKLVCDGKITVGTKLVTHGAELMNCEQGVAPWEDTSLVRLKISGNSTRRGRWAAKLGFHGNGAMLSYLTAVKPEGGKISKLRVVVTRVYPMLYVEKFDDGSTVTRSERLENLHQMKYEMERETLLEKVYEEVEKEFCLQASQSDSVEDDRKSLESGSQIYHLMKKTRDPAEFRASLTHSQARLLQEYLDRRRDIFVQELQARVQSVLKKRGLNVARNVVAMLKIRVADVYRQNVTKAMITIWRPHESLLQILREGSWLDVHNVVPTGVRYSELQISAGKQSMFRKASKATENMVNIARTFERKCYLIQELTQNPYMNTDYNEVDTVGFVFDIEPSFKEFDSKKQLFQNVFLADANKKIICVNFWGGIKKFGFESILETEQVVACVNLQKRSGNSRKNIPQYRATEFTYFTKTPKIDVCRKACDDLSKKFLSLDRRKFISDCKNLRNNLVNVKYGNIENISPYRFNNSDYNLSKNKIFLNSPNPDPNLNLNGLDFDSTFIQSDTVLSPKAMMRKKEISERIAKLKRYGEPPPLSSIHIVNRSRDAVKPYRSPLILKAEDNKSNCTNKLESVKPQEVSVASSTVGNPGGNSDRCTSPVLPYKRRSVNPVRLNFSKQNDVSKDDPFGEDFETSPPLSLD